MTSWFEVVGCDGTPRPVCTTACPTWEKALVEAVNYAQFDWCTEAMIYECRQTLDGISRSLIVTARPTSTYKKIELVFV